MADLERVNLIITGHVDHGHFPSHMLRGNRKIYGSRSHAVLARHKKVLKLQKLFILIFLRVFIELKKDFFMFTE